jgi:hypothetical protein
MRYVHIVPLSALIAALLVASPALAQTGNGAPSGAHYNLNIIGVSNPKTQPMTGGDRHTIFVGLGSDKQGGDVITPIYLTQGTFAVCDGNGFDPATSCAGNVVASAGAVFQLPCDTVTDTCVSGTSQAYGIWARALGQPSGNATVTTCATDLTTNTVVCSSENTVLVRGGGQQKFKNVTAALTTLTGTTVGTVSLFQAGFNNFFWQYDSHGLRLAQVRFYAE